MDGFEKCVEPLLSRRSVRVFEDRDVPLELILKALDVARHAPSARNSQPWRFVVVRDRGKLEELSKIHVGAAPLRRARAAVIVLADMEASPTSYVADGAIATTYLWLALHCLGLGAVWIQTLRNVEEVRHAVKAPGKYVPVAILAIGWPAEKPAPKPRKALKEVVDLEEFGSGLGEAGA